MKVEKGWERNVQFATRETWSLDKKKVIALPCYLFRIMIVTSITQNTYTHIHTHTHTRALRWIYVRKSWIYSVKSESRESKCSPMWASISCFQQTKQFNDSLIWLVSTFRFSEKLKARTNYIKESPSAHCFVCWPKIMYVDPHQISLPCPTPSQLQWGTASATCVCRKKLM